MKQLLAVIGILLPFLSACQPLTLKGKLINEQNEPVAGATVILKRTGFTTVSDKEGAFTISNTGMFDTVIITATGYERVEEPSNERGLVTVILRRSYSRLDDVIVIAYGTTTRRLATGSVGKLGGEDIARQPVSNPLLALEGRVPGLTVVQSSGLPGTAVSLQVRGQSSLTQGSEPLYIIDGVPFAPGNGNTARLSSLLSGGLSPFATINPADIESIEVLKDADATAIYGSRGANGVVLITTRRGAAGAVRVTARFTTGWGRATAIPEMLNTPQYVAMRREAFANDGAVPTMANAPDLMLWDTARYTDFGRLLLGGTARTSEGGLSLSGGIGGTTFSASLSGRRESTVFPGDLHDTKLFSSLSMAHTSPGKRFTASFSASFSGDNNRLSGSGGASFLALPPNAPDLYTSTGALNWEEGGVAFSNPLAFLARRYTARSVTMLTNGVVAYTVFPGFTLRASMGYNRLGVDETFLTPIAAQNPSTAPKGSAQFGVGTFSGWIAEPQAVYNKSVGKARIELLGGGSFQQKAEEGFSIGATGYTSDALLSSLAAAPTIGFRNNSRSDYRYAAVFGRVTLTWSDRYILNASGRRDGSSRFGPGSQFATFGALGGAWIFSKEAAVKNALPFLSFGKLRASWGTTGNDQIGDYKYLDAWSVASPYGGGTALFPAALYNPSYGWERVEKGELALELGFWQNRLLLSASGYRHRSSNQLVEYALPSQTGFFSITDNFPALVQNSGWEFELTTVNVARGSLRWSTTANLSVPRNKLLAFPGLATSAYASTYVVGQPLSVINRLRLTGVDPATGVFAFEDVNKDGAIMIPGDYAPGGYLAPDFFGGFGNTVSFKGWEAHIFFVFKKGLGESYLAGIYSGSAVPGGASNLPVDALDRWRSPGDRAAGQKFTASTSGPAYAAATRFRSSGGLYTDASFARLKTFSLAYAVPGALLKRVGLQGLRFNLQAQNLFTFTAYKGADPETQNLYGVPPLRMIQAGIQINL